MRNVVALVLVSCFAFSIARAQPDVTAGHRAFELCAGCHGFVGEGNKLVGAPRLAGMESWYVARQMRNFSGGIRGHLDGDDNGQRMARMAQAVDSERKLEDLVAYIDSLPVGDLPEATVIGDIDRGQSAYSLCAACHGPQARGSESIGAPALTFLDDWYLIEQLRLYTDGLRGVHQEDSYGQQMRALSSGFSDPDIRRDLAVYIDSLSR